MTRTDWLLRCGWLQGAEYSHTETVDGKPRNVYKLNPDRWFRLDGATFAGEDGSPYLVSLDDAVRVQLAAFEEKCSAAWVQFASARASIGEFQRNENHHDRVGSYDHHDAAGSADDLLERYRARFAPTFTDEVSK